MVDRSVQRRAGAQLVLQSVFNPYSAHECSQMLVDGTQRQDGSAELRPAPAAALLHIKGLPSRQSICMSGMRSGVWQPAQVASERTKLRVR